MLLGVGKFTFIFSTQFYKGTDMAEDSHVGRNIADNRALPDGHCSMCTVSGAAIVGPDELNTDSLWKDS